MKQAFRTIARALLILTPALGSVSGAAQFWFQEELPRRTYTSPAGHYTFEVDPTQRDGSGPGRYRLELNGEVAWQQELPFTFEEGAVSDGGVAVGYRHTEDWPGELVFTILDPEGGIRAEKRIQRIEPTGFSHGSPRPWGLGVSIVPEGDLALFRVSDPETSRQLETWHRFRLADGSELEPVSAKEQLKQLDDAWWTMRSFGVPDTPLTFCQWNDAPDRDGLFSLHDAEGRVVWEMVLPDEYDHSDPYEHNLLTTRIRKEGAILDLGARTFDLWHVREEERVRYEIRGESGSWEVVELERQAYTPPSTTSPMLEVGEPEGEAQVLGTVQFGPTGPPQPAKGVLDWDIDDQGRIAAIVRPEQDGQPFRCRFIRGARDLLLDYALEGVATEPWPQFTLNWITGERWLLTVTTEWASESPEVSAFWFEPTSGELEKIDTRIRQQPTEVAACPDGGFIILAKYTRFHQAMEYVASFAPSGKERWRLAGDDDETTVSGVSSVTVSRTGEVILLDLNKIAVFSADGAFQHAFPLDRALGEEINDELYLTRVRVLPDGGYLLYGSHFVEEGGHLYHLNSRAELLGSVVITEANGRINRTLRFERVGGDGRLWGTSLSTFVVFDEDGRATWQLGPPRSVEAITRVHWKGTFVDSHGNVYLLDEATGMLHSFTAEGVSRWIAPVPGQHFNWSQIAVRGDQHAFFKAGRELIELDEAGERVPQSEGSADLFGIPGQLSFAPRSKRYWIRWNGAVHSSEEDGTQIVTINKRLDGRWYPEGDLLAGADGSLALIWTGAFVDHELIVFNPDGTERFAYMLPEGFLYANAAYDGKRLVLRRDDRLLFVDLDGSNHRLLTLEEHHGHLPFLSPDGKEVWLFNGEPRMTRVAVPD